ncbi:hypothetical protein FH972_020000 [Carpinus fangiana]|uniref:Uncharacterized protein n=1 Tax=Carpinus fangiana TaxID=176857 RepID=A0A5N6RTE9_9ROSI|nr:hypothetical protein FH972_020000 [Carpinus fangiana]
MGIKPGKLQRHTKHLNRTSKYYPHLACDPSQSIEAQPQHKTTNIHQNKRIKVNPSSTTSISKDKRDKVQINPMKPIKQGGNLHTL